MHRSTPYFIVGTVAAVTSLVLMVLGYHLAAEIAVFIAFFPSTLAVKNGAGNLAMYIFLAVALLFGYLFSPGEHYALPLAMLILAMVPCIRMIFFKAIGNGKYPYTEAALYLTGISIFIGGNIYYHADWVQWVFPAIACSLSTFLAAMFTAEKLDIKLNIRDRYNVKPGSTAPGFTLPDQDGNTTSLSEYKNKRHVLVIFVRGDWCPTCHIMLRTYEREKAKFAEKNIVLLAIGPDPAGVNKAMVQHLGLDYKILSDDKNEAARAYGMMFHKNNPDTKFQEGIPLPAAFLVDITGTVVYTTNPKKPGEILRPDMIFPVIEKLQVA
jgi:peroxiredoxin